MTDQRWKYNECPNCNILWPHATTPPVCACGNDMMVNHNKKELILIKFEDCSGRYDRT